VNRLGIVGTMVWDTIHGRGDSAAPVEEWGGIAYALAALEVSLPAEWQIVPLIKVGRDLADRANEFLGTLTRRSTAARFIEVPEPNNRVTIRYADAVRRAERLSGGVPPWQWHELGPLVRDLDAIYVNFISGFEMTLETARLLRRGFDGPMYADLHSLMLGVDGDGFRVPQRRPDVVEWFRCFDAIQINEDELDLVGEDPMAVAAIAMAQGVHVFVVTLGERGAVYFAAGNATFREVRRQPLDTGRPVTTGRIPADLVEVLDPTGCGDVFGGALVAELVCGTAIADAVRRANALAGRNVRYRGAAKLQYHLRGEIVPT
jgi:sugar/nucleoside kinase (ribokinase family)